MLIVFLKILVIFLMVGIGFISNKAHVLNGESNKHLVNLMLIITNPALILSSMSNRTPNPKLVNVSITVVIGSIVFFLIVSAISFCIVKLLKYEPEEDAGILMVTITAVNTGFMGFPITKAIFGDELMFLMVIENIVLNLYLFSLCIMQMNYGSKSKISLKYVIRSSINLCTIAALFGILFFATGLKLPTLVYDLLSSLGSATIPISMIVVGIQLAESDVARMAKNKKLLLACISNEFLVPAITFATVYPLPIATAAKATLIFASCFPCAVVTVGIATKECRNSSLMAEAVALTTFMSMITLPVSAYLISLLLHV